jgi:hypothetical protein
MSFAAFEALDVDSPEFSGVVEVATVVALL